MEIVITLFIAATLVVMGVFTLQTYLPKQRLLDSMETTEQVLNRAQFEATSRSTWSCVKYDSPTGSTPGILYVYMDTNANHTGGASNCGEGTDTLITKQQLRENVDYPSCSNFNSTSPVLWFDSAGIPKECSAGSCTTSSFQIFVSNSKLPSGIKAREIEVVSSGLISIIDRNDPGYITTLFAKTTSLTGSGACE